MMPLLIFVICVYTLVRKACEAAAAFSLGFFKAHFLGVFAFLDILTVGCVAYAVIFNNQNPGAYRSGYK